MNATEYTPRPTIGAQEMRRGLPTTPESVTLAKGQSFLLDPTSSIIPIEDVLPGVTPQESDRFKVMARIASPKHDSKGTPEANPIDAYIIRYDNSNGIPSFFISGKKFGPDGRMERTVRKQLPPNGVVTLGRLTPQSVNDPYHIDGKDLTGTEFSRMVSRKHVAIECTEKGIKITDTSSNGTTVEGYKLPVEQFAGSGVVGLSGVEVSHDTNGGVLINSVPKTGEEARQARADAADRERRARVRPLVEARVQLEQRQNKIYQLHNPTRNEIINRYVSMTIRKSDAQQRGDGEDSIRSGQEAGQALQSLTPAEQQDAGTLLELQKRINELNQRIYE